MSLLDLPPDVIWALAALLIGNSRGTEVDMFAYYPEEFRSREWHFRDMLCRGEVWVQVDELAAMSVALHRRLGPRAERCPELRRVGTWRRYVVRAGTRPFDTGVTTS